MEEGFLDLGGIDPEIIPEIKTDLKKPNSSRDVVFKKEGVLVGLSENRFVYLVFAFQKVCEEYGIDYNECLLLIYLEELGLFPLKIRVCSKTFFIRDYVLKGLVFEDYSHKGKKLYRLSKRALEILKRLDDLLSDDSRFVGMNRNTETHPKIKMKDALSNYFR